MDFWICFRFFPGFETPIAFAYFVSGKKVSAITLAVSRIKKPIATLVERLQTDVEQFLEMLRFENRSKVEELSIIFQ